MRPSSSFLLTCLVLCLTGGCGFGRPLSERVHEWFAVAGGDVVWSPLVERWVPVPE